MNPVVYNASLATGVVLASGGVWALHGPGAAAVVAGGLVLALTIFSAWIGGR
jgi:hypothetical protein